MATPVTDPNEMIDTTASGHYVGDCRELLARLPAGSIQTCITSPPYWGLRDYGVDGQIGLEPTPEAYVATIVEVFEGVWDALADDGTLWLNIGDSYSHGGCGARDGERWPKQMTNIGSLSEKTKHAKKHTGLKPKDLIGIPWMVAFALRAAGWYLRMDVIWSKPNPMPESVADRPTKAHEYMFLFAKSEQYFYDGDAIREPLAEKTFTTFGASRKNKASAEPGENGRVFSQGLARDCPERKPKLTEGGEIAGANKRSVWTVDEVEPARRARSGNKTRKNRADHGGAKDTGANQMFGVPWEDEDGRRNKRSVWTVAPVPYDGAHFAVFPPQLIEPCVLASSRPGDIVLDPFFGSGTTGQVAEKHERRWIGFDLNPKYAELAKARTAQRSLPLSRRT